MNEIVKATLAKTAKHLTAALELERSNAAQLSRLAKALGDVARLVENRSTDPAIIAAKSILSNPHVERFLG